MSFPKYPNYQDTGSPVIGCIPEGWKVVELKRLLSRNDGGVWGGDPTGNDDVIVLRSTEQTQDGRWKIDDPAFRNLSEAERASSTLIAGDLLITKSSGSSLHIGKTTIVDAAVQELSCCYSNFMQRLRANDRLSPRFGWYVLNNEVARTQFGVLSNSTTGLANLSAGLIGSVLFPVPPLEEQVDIAAFLDRETGKIDALVEEQRHLIALLKEKRQAVISHAVTKGLDPHAPMKDSGSRWLGEVPAHWATMPLMRLTAPGRDIMYGIVLPGPDVGEGGVPIVKGGDVKPHRLRLDLLNRTTAEIEAPFARARLRPNDIVYSIRGSIGDAEPVLPDLEGANITQDVARVSPRDDINCLWLLYVMKSKPIFIQLEQRSLGAAVRGINIFDLKRACVPVPPPAEQVMIARYLDTETQRIDELAGAAEAGITLLRERRAALISAAVTGKINVRGSANVQPFPIERARARALVGTEIIERSAGQPTFGRVKFQKVAFLAEGHVGICELAGCYTRAAAGPLDGALIEDMERGAYSIAGIAVDQTGGTGTTVSYRLGQQPGAHRQELADWLGPDRTGKLDKLIAHFAPLTTKQAEAVATLYGVWNDLLSEGASPSDDEIIIGFLDEWHPEKREKFRASELAEWLGWMRRHGIVPTGSSPKTTTGRLFV